MKKPGLIFTTLSVYIIIAFGWWTFAHIRDNNSIYEGEKNALELSCYKATLDVNGALSQEMFNDTNDVKKYFAVNFPDLEILFYTTEPDPMNNFMIRPKINSYELIKQEGNRKVWMYLLEGFVMTLLLFWGIIWIYRSLQARIRLRRQQSNFLLSITHELKTPLASIKLYLETLKKRKLDTEQTETIISNSLQDIERLHELVENLLLAAQLDNHKYEPVFKEINLSEFVNETIEKFAVPRRIHHNIAKNLEKNILINADQNALIMVLNNLLSNATKYSPENSTIEILLRTDNEHIILSVSNEGTSINEEDKKNLFTQFYRAGDENIRKTKGTGLGLFIVKNLLNLHKAVISVKDKHPNGTIFEIQFQKNA